MSTFDNIANALATILKEAKELPTEKIAAVGLMLIGTLSILKDASHGDNNEIIETAKKLLE